MIRIDTYAYRNYTHRPYEKNDDLLDIENDVFKFAPNPKQNAAFTKRFIGRCFTCTIMFHQNGGTLTL